MDIANNIKRLRRNKNMTQDELASLIGCSAKTVSKWECGDGYPDITFVPIIANVFNVTTDELFGMDEVRKRERIAEYMRRIINVVQNLTQSGYDIKDISPMQSAKDEIALEALREFAGDLKTEVQFAGQLSEKYQKEKIAIYERVLERSTDDGLRNGTRIALAQVLERMGDIDRAIEIINALPTASMGASYLLPQATRSRGRAGLKNMQRSIIEAYQLISTMIGMMKSMQDDGDIYSAADRARLDIIDLELRILMEDDITTPVNIIGRCLSVALFSVEAALYDQALDYLEKAAGYAEEYAALPDDRAYTGVLKTEMPELWSLEQRTGMRSSLPPMHKVILDFISKLITPTFDGEKFAKAMGLSSPDEIDAESDAYKVFMEFKTKSNTLCENPRFNAVLERLRKPETSSEENGI